MIIPEILLRYVLKSVLRFDAAAPCQGRKKMDRAKSGDLVSIHFTGMTEDQRVIATSQGGEPVKFQIGSRAVIRGIENAVVGMQVGERRMVSVAPEEGFGARREELVTTVKKDDFPDGVTPSVGSEYNVKVAEGKTTSVRVTEIKGNEVVLDANHALAGRTLNFDIQLLDIQPAAGV